MPDKSATKFPRYETRQLLNSNLSKPDTLDYIEFQHDGVTFRCFGILHGITGGLNFEYRNFIKQSIKSVDGIKLAEKGMRSLYPYCQIDAELEDWAVLRPIDCFLMGFKLIIDPRCLWMISIDSLRELWRQSDAFVAHQRLNISDLGESPFFHYLDEHERRKIAGFCPPKQALSQDIQSLSHWYSALLAKQRDNTIIHPQWKRILLLERYMHIPARSVHMLAYATAFAKKHNHKLVNLFVGETHNTDMQYLARECNQLDKTFNTQQLKTINKINTRAISMANPKNKSDRIKFSLNKISYLFYLLLGTASALSLYLAIFTGFY